MSTKYIFVTGGVVSSIGKGIVAASLGRLLKNRGLKVTIQKFDPYINIDPGTMSPYQHVGIFVEIDIDETFIVTQVQICLSSVICHKNFPVLVRAHSSRIDIDIRSNF